MDLEGAIRHRRMCRDFSPEPVPSGTVERLVELASRGPSAGFTQGLDWLVIEGDRDRWRFFEATSDPGWLAQAGSMSGLLKAPLIMVPVGDPGAYMSRYTEEDKASSGLGGLSPEEWPVPYWTVDAAMAVMLLLLAAEDAGLGALFFRLHRPAAQLLDAFGVPSDRQLIGAVAIGWPAAHEGPSGSPASRRRRSMDETVHRGSW